MKKLHLLLILTNTILFSSLNAQNCYNRFNYSINGMTVQFIDSSFVPSGNPLHLWTLGDGDSSNLENPSHTYSTPGYYTVCHSLNSTTNACPGANQACAIIGVGITCNANFGYSINNNTVTFYDSSSSNGSNLLHYAWNFGPNASNWYSYQKNPIVTFTTPGTYPICLTIQDSLYSCFSTICDTIVIGSGCTANFDYSFSPSQSNTVKFTNKSLPSFGITYSWSFGDGTSSSLANPTHFYPNNIPYVVSLTASTSTGGSCSFIDTIYVNNCNAYFSSSIGSNGNVTFANLSEVNNIANFSWGFGDGSPIFQTASKSSISHTYTTSGSYFVTLSLTDSQTGCVSTFYDSITVNLNNQLSCNASFYPVVDTSQQFNIILYNNSSTGQTHQYFWDFGDGNTATGMYPTHYYSGFGSYIVCLTVVDSVQNCIDIFCDTLGMDSSGNLKSGGFGIEVKSPTIVSISENVLLNSNKIKLYPNPANKYVILENPYATASEYSLELFDITGKTVISLPNISPRHKLDLSNVKTGVYFIVFKNGESQHVKKLVKN